MDSSNVRKTLPRDMTDAVIRIGLLVLLAVACVQVMLPFGTMSPDMSVKMARNVYNKVPYMSKVFEDKFNQQLLALIADNGYNLGTNFDWSTVNPILRERNVRLLSAGIDEVPMVYKDIHQVMAAQTDLVEVLAEFMPRLVKMAPSGERPED